MSTASYVLARNCQNKRRMEASGRDGLERLQMHILAMLGAIVGGAMIWYWHFRTMRDAGNEVIDLVGRARGAYRMFNFRMKAENSVFTSVDDPALAAAIFLFALANEAGVTARAEAEIRKQISTITSLDRLDEVLTYADWAARNAIDARDCARRFRGLWRANLTIVERKHLLCMAVAVRGAAPQPEHMQKLAIETLETALAL